MAAIKKYAGLPDVDEGVEIYESTLPDLTEASTLPAESVDESDDENPNFDKGGLDADAARHRFEPTIIDASNANFSDTVDGGRHAYRVRTRRRRRRYAQTSDDSDDSDEETLQGRLARLKREAAELQAEIEKIEKNKEKDRDTDDDSDYEDTVDHPGPQDDLVRGTEELNKTLEAVSMSSRKKGRTLEDEFTHNLDRGPLPLSDRRTNFLGGIDTLSQSSVSAIAAFSDRLTALEKALGVTSTSLSTTTSAILPTLDSLSTQIDTLSATLTPRADSRYPQQPNTTTLPTSTVHLDPLAQKIRYLITESKRLEDSRRAATKSFDELLETRDRHAHLIQHTHTHSSIHTGVEPRMSRHASTQDINDSSVNGNGNGNGNGNVPATVPANKTELQNQFTSLFLDDQASRISALYALLPTIQSLQPLLPVVLERLRALSVIHTGAGEVRGELDEIETRLEGQERNVQKWRAAVEDAEKAMAEGSVVMKENATVIGAMVRGLEGKVKRLSER